MKFCLTYGSFTSHCAIVATAYKQANNIITEDWPVRSADVKVIQHAWNMLKRDVYARQPAPNNLAELVWYSAGPRRVEPLGPKRAEAAGAQSSKQVS